MTSLALKPGAKHVQYVLTADFDIDAGPTMTNQYPAPIQGDPYLMAELMLPDQSHAREQDWTIFLLHSTPDGQLQYHIEDEDVKHSATKYYVLNLVNTKYNPQVKRGAVVKAMSIVTPHPFFHVFKPLLILALDAYFKAPGTEPLQTLYEAINSLDLSGMPTFSLTERMVLASSENTTLFNERFEGTANALNGSSLGGLKETDARNANGVIGNGINGINGINGTNGNGIHNTNGTDSADQTTPYYIDLRSQSLVSRIARDSHFFETKINYNRIPIPVKVPVDALEECVGDGALIRLLTTLTQIQSSFNVLHPHLTVYGPSTPAILVLINALLTQKRVLFVGLNSSSADITAQVLAACALASGGILRSFTTQAYPYTDLSKVDDLLTSPGYVAGVKNPAFERHSAWWDVLIDTEAQTMRISPDLDGAFEVSALSTASTLSSLDSSRTPGSAMTPTHSASTAVPTTPTSTHNSRSSTMFSGPVSPEDVAFVAEIRRMIANHFGEFSLRTHCHAYIHRFVRIATVYEEDRNGRTELWPADDPQYTVVAGHGYIWQTEARRRLDLATYAPVIEGWHHTRSYRYYIEDQRKIWAHERASSRALVDYPYHLDRLSVQTLTPQDSALVLHTLYTHATDHDSLNRLLAAAAPRSPAITPLFYISLGLFHRDPSIRSMTVVLLQRLETHTAGKVFFRAMSQFQKLAYRRLQAELVEKAKEEVEAEAEEERARTGQMVSEGFKTGDGSPF